jgi:hypothetical protein
MSTLDLLKNGMEKAHNKVLIHKMFSILAKPQL